MDTGSTLAWAFPREYTMIATTSVVDTEDAKKFVASNTHRYIPKFATLNEKKKVSCEVMSLDENLYINAEFYKDFGFGDAIAVDEEHLSYVAELSEDVRLLVICNDTAEGNNKTYDDEFLKWIENQAKKAQEDGKMMIAMEHYPVLPGQPILALIPDARQKESKKLIETLADNGVHLIFTGHMHNQSINVVETEKGNKFYDVCTGSLIGCPAFMRLVTIKDENTVEIKSIPVPEFQWDKKGKTGEQYLQDQFDRMLITLIGGMKDTPEKVLGKFGIGDKTATLYNKMGIYIIIYNPIIGGLPAGLIIILFHYNYIKNNKKCQFQALLLDFL